MQTKVLGGPSIAEQTSSEYLSEMSEGIFLMEHHAKMIWQGNQSMIVKSIGDDSLIGNSYYLNGGNSCYGVLNVLGKKQLGLADFEALSEQHRMSNDERIVVINADLGKATHADKFRCVCPERFFEVGIAEANMIGIASGMSEYGYKVVISSFSSFLTGRYDIIRCSLAYPNCPVVIVGSHSGMAIGKDGVTQMGLEDVNLMRGLPNMQILQPSTYIEAKRITEYVINDDKLTYLRIGRQPCVEVFDESYQFEFGKGNVIVHGLDTTIFSSGCVLEQCMEAADKSQLCANLINMPTIKPIDHEIIMKYANKSNLLVTVEDHSIVGGLGTAVAEVLAENGCSTPMIRIGINDAFVESGPPNDLYKKYGLTKDAIVQRVLSNV